MRATDGGFGVRTLSLLAAFLATGCLSNSQVRKETITLELSIQDNRDNAMACAPRELAEAEASIEFSRYESSMGRPQLAHAHLKHAQGMVAAVLQKSKGAACEGDRDGDGVPDTLDRCPDIPEDFDGDNDADGCPDYDRDNDGVADDRDQCPVDKEDKDGFEDNDGCPDFDNDRDGLMDNVDQCPNEAEDFDGYQDLDGCPDNDNDGDDIPDVQDRCPNKAGNKSAGGCPDTFRFILVRESIIELRRKILFKGSSSTINPRSYPILGEVAQALTRMPGVGVRIEGHTDSEGPESRNQRVSQRRANAVRKYLMKKGIPGQRLVAVGYGEDRPVDDNDTDEGRENNRRVEFHLIKR
jgi:outer membrane protein OmpA-like peptidoglycan-associated protein